MENDREVTITVGNGENCRHFKGSRKRLAAASGTLSQLIQSSGDDINVPGVTAEVFAILLRFVDTGVLDPRPDNVYSLLVAAHLLHMPVAVEQCRAFLRTQPPPPPPPPPLVKPVAAKVYWSSPFWSPLYSFYREPVPSTSNLSLETHSFNSQAEPSLLPADAKNKIEDTKTILKDIACCDGPVRFKRVLNINYGLPQKKTDVDKIRPEVESRRVFVCRYCKHTFKSNYCYRKHTRRHLNPINAEVTDKECGDMNVQYYPCKTCGSKFPSYYFVHKHRKLCHAGEKFAQESSQDESNRPSPE